MKAESKSTYFDWLRLTAKGCILAWRNIPEHAVDAWDSFCDFAWSLLLVLWLLVVPLLTPLSPIIALLLRREMRRQQERKIEAVRHAKDRFFSRGGDSTGGAK